MKAFLKAAVSLALIAQLHAIPVRFLAWDPAVAGRKVSLVTGDTSAVPIENLHPLQRTRSLNATPGDDGGMKLRTLDKTDADGKPAELVVKIQSTFTKPLVLLLPDDKAPSGLRGFVIEDSEGNFAWGSFRILNATGKGLAIALGSEKKLLPASWTPIDLKPSGDKAVPVIVVAQSDSKTALFSGVWKPDADLRRLVIILPSTDVRNGPLALKVIPEDRTAKENAPPSTANSNNNNGR